MGVGAELAETVGAGTTVIPIGPSAGFEPGRVLMMNAGAATEELVVLAGLGSLILAPPGTRFEHHAGEIISQLSAEESEKAKKAMPAVSAPVAAPATAEEEADVQRRRSRGSQRSQA